MEVEYRTSFTRDLRQIRSAELRQRVIRRIEELEAASAITEVSGVRRITGVEDHYRVRIGEYRLGIALNGNVVILTRFLHRREFYRFFP